MDDEQQEAATAEVDVNWAPTTLYVAAHGIEKAKAQAQAFSESTATRELMNKTGVETITETKTPVDRYPMWVFSVGMVLGATLVVAIAFLYGPK